VGNIYKSADRGDRVYGAGGRLESVGLGSAAEVRYEHDADGQVIAKVLPAGGRWSYAWDHAGQLEAVVRPDGQRVTFVYDALGRRVEKAFGGRVTRYVWDGDVLVHELREGEALITWEFEPGGFALLAKVEGKQRFGAVTDHLGTPLVLFDVGGVGAGRGQLDLFGVAQVTVARTSCPWRWPGQYEDEETGLYYNRFRYYDPETGRYLSQDPLGLGGGLAAYGYVADPSAWYDPLGLKSCKAVTNKRNRALRDFDNRYFRVGMKQTLLTRERMDHILRRHHLDFWDGSAKSAQSFFAQRLSVEKIEDLIRQTISANRDSILRQSALHDWQIRHTIDGVTYVLGFNSGHIGQFYPKS